MPRSQLKGVLRKRLAQAGRDLFSRRDACEALGDLMSLGVDMSLCSEQWLWLDFPFKPTGWYIRAHWFYGRKTGHRTGNVNHNSREDHCVRAFVFVCAYLVLSR